MTFTIHENVQPSNEKQGYVIRRLLRRAVLDAYQMGHRDPFLSQIVPTVAEVMARPYPELKDSVPRIQTVISEEEEQFLKNLENGLKLLNNVFRKTKAAGSDTVSRQGCLRPPLHLRNPVEITESLAADQNLRVDRQASTSRWNEHGEISRGTTEAAAVFTTGPLDALKQSYHHGNEFLGYSDHRLDGKVIGIVEQNRLAESATASPDDGPPIVLVLDQTPFYGESGGQVGDTGVIRGEGFVFHVRTRRRITTSPSTSARCPKGPSRSTPRSRAEVDLDRREAIRRAHSATHVLHHALHIHLGKHAQQAGSKVEPDRLRFDFANPEAVGRDRLRLIEETVNHRVLERRARLLDHDADRRGQSSARWPCSAKSTPRSSASSRWATSRASFAAGPTSTTSSQVGLFKVVGEESVSAGTRRITALTGKAALTVRQEEQALADVASTLKVPTALVARTNRRPGRGAEDAQEAGHPAQGRHRPEDLARRPARRRDAARRRESRDGLDRSETPDNLRQMIDVLRRKQPTGLAVLLATSLDGKVHLAAGLTPDLIASA